MTERNIVTRRFMVEAGFLARRQIINGTISAAWELGLECSHERAGSTIRFTVVGPEDRVRRLMRGVAAACDED